MLRIASRHQFNTLLDAVTIADADERPTIIYLETGHEPKVISRFHLSTKITEVASALIRLNIRPGELVIIAHTQNLESIFAFWGVMAMGAIPSMFPTLTEKLDAEVYMSSMAELVRLSEVAAVLTTDDFAPHLRLVVTCPVHSSSDISSGALHSTAGSSPQLSPANASADDVALLQHSSGTTGLQKGVALSHSAILNQIAAYSEAIDLQQDDVIVSWLPLYHDMGLIAGFLLPIIQGVPLILMSPFDWVIHPTLLFRAIDQYRGTLCWLPNFAYNHCARRIRPSDSKGLSVASMRLFINCSEPVRYDSHQLFLERFAENGIRPEMLGVSYAMAENTFAVTQTTPGQPPRLDIIDRIELELNNYAKIVAENTLGSQIRVSCGRPIPGTQLRVVDRESQSLADRQVGEIAIRSDCLLTGYYNRSDLIPFNQDGWFLTGDMGYMAGGELFVVGRHKDLIINAGKNIYPADIEAIVNQVPGVHAGRAVAFGVVDDKEGTELVAVVAEVSTEDEGEKREISRAIRQEVSRQAMVTVSYVHLVQPKWLLKTSSGKLARGANRDKWLSELSLRRRSSM